MTKRNFPHIRLTSQTMKGNYYHAYSSSDDNAKRGYQIFISTTAEKPDNCDCLVFVYNIPCYHLIRARELEVFFSHPLNVEKI